jgi:tetratricopeptide (TPR) repeat protein
MHPGAFRVVNIILLGLLGWLIGLWISRYVRQPIAWLVAFLFILHPSNGFVINYVVGRADLLAGLGVVGFAYLQRCALEDSRWSLGQMVGAILFAVIALGAKETGLILLPIAFVQAWVYSNGKDASVHKATAMLIAAVTILYFAARLRVVASAWDSPFVATKDLTTNPLQSLDFSQRLPAALSIGWLYARQIVWPDTGFYHIPNVLPTWAHVSTWLGAITLLGGLVAAGWLFYRRSWLAMALTGAGAAYLIVGNLVLGVGVYMANRLMIPFLLGAAMITAYLLDRLCARSPRRWALAIAASAIVGVLMAGHLMHNVNPRWSRFDLLIAGEVTRHPNNYVGQYIHATALISRARELVGKPEAIKRVNNAVSLLEQLTKQRPDSIEVRMQLASVYMILRRDDEALEQYEAMLALDGELLEALSQAVALLIIKGEYEPAEALLARAYGLDDQSAAVLHNRAVVAAQGRRYVEAVKRYGELLDLYPHHDPGRAEFVQLQLFIKQLSGP